MIDYNEDRKELQTERMIDDFIAECDEKQQSWKSLLTTTLLSSLIC